MDRFVVVGQPINAIEHETLHIDTAYMYVSAFRAIFILCNVGILGSMMAC